MNSSFSIFACAFLWSSAVAMDESPSQQVPTDVWVALDTEPLVPTQEHEGLQYPLPHPEAPYEAHYFVTEINRGAIQRWSRLQLGNATRLARKIVRHGLSGQSPQLRPIRGDIYQGMVDAVTRQLLQTESSGFDLEGRIDFENLTIPGWYKTEADEAFPDALADDENIRDSQVVPGGPAFRPVRRRLDYSRLTKRPPTASDNAEISS